MADILGYARVSTGDQDVAGQTMRLTEAGAIKTFTDVMSGKRMDRPGLTALLVYARLGDTLAVVRLDPSWPLAGGIAVHSHDAARTQDRAAQPRGKDRYLLGGRRTDFPRLRRHCHFEQRLISERTKDGIAAARAKGRNRGDSRSV